jgi:hypothetical protein
MNCGLTCDIWSSLWRTFNISLDAKGTGHHHRYANTVFARVLRVHTEFPWHYSDDLVYLLYLRIYSPFATVKNHRRWYLCSLWTLEVLSVLKTVRLGLLALRSYVFVLYAFTAPLVHRTVHNKKTLAYVDYSSAIRAYDPRVRAAEDFTVHMRPPDGPKEQNNYYIVTVQL